MTTTETCEMPDRNPLDEEVRTLLENARTLAVVGLSDNPDRDSYRVAKYLKEQGYHIIPVNPNATEILGERSYASLADISVPVDIVDIFRRPEAIPAVVEEAVRIGAGAVWMQRGLAHAEAAGWARAAGLAVVQSRCIKIEHERLFGGGKGRPDLTRGHT